MDERDFIDLLRPLAGRSPLLQTYDFQDDAALLKPPAGQDVVISSDTMVEGVHFPTGRIGGGFSERLLRTALSDLAAKAARPVGYVLNVSWPRERDPKWVSGFISGLRDTQNAFECPLIGGDTTATTGPLCASVTVLGLVPSGQMVKRDGAQIGDDVWYTGTLGRAEQGLRIIQGESVDLSPDEFHACETAYLRPEPRFLLRKVLRDYATAAADISDGLWVDAGHIARASGVALDLAPVPNAEFGDDYEILFTSDPSNRAAVEAGASAINLSVTRCGIVIEGEGVLRNGEPVELTGFCHRFD